MYRRTPVFIIKSVHRRRDMDGQNITNTQVIGFYKETERPNVSDVLRMVYDALVEKGYNPIYQITGYIMSGDPTYITSHRNARSLIMKVERDEILEELVANYIDTKINRQ